MRRIKRASAFFFAVVMVALQAVSPVFAQEIADGQEKPETLVGEL